MLLTRKVIRLRAIGGSSHGFGQCGQLVSVISEARRAMFDSAAFRTIPFPARNLCSRIRVKPVDKARVDAAPSVVNPSLGIVSDPGSVR